MTRALWRIIKLNKNIILTVNIGPEHSGLTDRERIKMHGKEIKLDVGGGGYASSKGVLKLK